MTSRFELEQQEQRTMSFMISDKAKKMYKSQKILFFSKKI